MSPLKGPVRFRFRAPDDDVDVLIQGDAVWVNTLRENLGLMDVGWVQPMAITGRSAQEQIEGDDEPETFTLEQYTTNLKFGDRAP